MSLLPSSPTMQNTRSVRGGFALAALAALALVVAVVNLSHMSSRRYARHPRPLCMWARGWWCWQVLGWLSRAVRWCRM